MYKKDVAVPLNHILFFLTARLFFINPIFPRHIHPSVPPSLPDLSSSRCSSELCLSLSPFIFHFSPSIIHPPVTCPQGPVNNDGTLKYIFPLICFPLDPSIPCSSPLLLLPSHSFISPQNPAVLASVSELSPPQTWRPRSPAPRKGSELEDRKKSKTEFLNPRHNYTLPSLLLDQART